MSSRCISQLGMSDNASRLVTSYKKLNEKFNTTVKGQFNHTIIIRTGNVTINGDDLDCEFTIPFDDDTEANEAEIIIYNLSSKTISGMQKYAKITVTAGYGKDTGLIFSGYIMSKKTKYEDCDKVTTIKALDDRNRKEKKITSVTFAKKTKASKILRYLCKKVGLPIAQFSIKRDYTYKDEETVDGELMDNIKRLAKICGVSAYILKGKIYVRPLNTGDNTTFTLSTDTGLLDISEYSETETNEIYQDTTKGYEVEMLLQHQLQTASIITVKSKTAKGKYRVKSGSHEYDGTKMVTKAKLVAQISTKVKKG